jgi:hypothetical protein
MKSPSLTRFLGIKDPRESLEPAKVPEMSREALGPKEVYLAWERILTTGDKTVLSERFTRPAIIIGMAIGLVLLIMQEFILMLTIGIFIFFLQALKKMPPEAVKYEINSHGVMIGDSLYYWDTLSRFFFMSANGSEVLAIDTTLGFPGRLYIHFDSAQKEKIKELLDKYLHYLESEPRTFFDNTYDRIVKKFNFEDDVKPTIESVSSNKDVDSVETDASKAE